MSARTEPRFTRDADIAVAVAGDAEGEELIHSLRARNYGIEAVVAQQSVGRLAPVRLTLSDVPQAPVIDLLFASSMTARGYHRGRALLADLTDLVGR